tara:strand:+ start:2421 stop:2900 length:480 start_codon:yes stop_codon:yes gene_type:complete
MKKINHILSILLLFLTSCGFSPMLKDVDLGDLKITKIKYSGPSDLVYTLRSNLNIPINKTAKGSYIINIKIQEGATSVTKDKAGITTREEITIGINFEIIDNDNNVLGSESLNDSKTVSITNDISTDTEIKRVEKENIISNLIQQLTFAIRAKMISIQK